MYMFMLSICLFSVLIEIILKYFKVLLVLLSVIMRHSLRTFTQMGSLCPQTLRTAWWLRKKFFPPDSLQNFLQLISKIRLINPKYLISYIFAHHTKFEFPQNQVQFQNTKKHDSNYREHLGSCKDQRCNNWW